MKKKLIPIVLTSFLFMLSFVALAIEEPGDPGSTPSGGGIGTGGGAPIAGGTLILLGLGAAYGGRKIYNLYKDNQEELED